MRDIIELIESKSTEKNVEIVKLSYSESALQPVFSAGLMRLHYGKLAHGYAERFNNNQGDKTFNYAGYWLHNLFFTQFRPPRVKNEPNGPVGNLIKSKFKTYDALQDAVQDAAMKLHGSGWVYLARDGSIKTINNHEVRNDILVLIDCWEHSFQMDYGADKQRYLNNIWRIMDWNMINSRWGSAYK